MSINVTEIAWSTVEAVTNGSGGMRPPPQSQTLRVVLSYLITGMLAIVMVGMGCAVDLKEVKKHAKRPTGIIIGFVCQFGLMPAIAAMLAAIFQMPEVETLALLITGSCPGGSASNVATYWVAGDISLSVTMTTISSTLGLGLMPLLLFIYQETYGFTLKVPFDTIGIALATLIVPIALGIFIKWKFSQHAKKIANILSVVGILAILTVAVISIITYGSTFSLIPAQIACAAIFPGVGMVLGYAISSLVSLIRPLRLRHTERRAVCFETGIQNAQLAAGVMQLSQATLGRYIGRMILFPVIYLASQIVWVIAFVIVYQIYKRRFAPQTVEPQGDKDTKEDEEGSKVQEEKEDREEERKNGYDNTAFSVDLPPKYQDTVDNEKVEFDHNTMM